MSSFSVEKWAEFSVEDIYHPKYQECLGWFMEITFGISCLFYGFTAFIILTKSPKQMGAFKYTVFTQLTFNMLYKALMFIYNPIFHFPLIAVSFNRSFKFSSIWAIVFFGSSFFVTISAAFALLFSVVTRLFAAFSTTSTSTNFISLKYGISAACGLTIFAWASICS
uniref:Uncharacterized protein n=1 Tax=Panagrolaimus sp. PS1159 TaxID=55785 RepID=A0AC35FNC4_9BILA